MRVLPIPMPRRPSLRDFLKSGERSRHCYDKPFRFYVRKARRILDGRAQRAFDVATIDSDRMGSGKLPQIFDHIEALAREFKFEAVYVESVINHRLRGWLLRRGYQKVPNSADPQELSPCYWKSIQ